MKAIDIIRRSMRLIGALGVGEAPTAEESSDCLTALNALISSWNVDALTIYSDEFPIVSLKSGQSSYSVGVDGDFDIERPDKILRAYFESNASDFEMAKITQDTYQAIENKNQTGIPADYVYNPTFPEGTFYVFPVPNQDMNIKLFTYKKIPRLKYINDDIIAPEQYERALAYNLAIEIAPEFGQMVTPDVSRIAMEALANAKRMNIKPATLQTEIFGMTEISGRQFNIQKG